LAKDYRERYEHALCPIARALSEQLEQYLATEPRIDRIHVRAKSVSSFMGKAAAKIDGHLKYEDPLAQIQDQIGARIVTFYNSDIERIKRIIEKYYRPIEKKSRAPDSEWEFGYFGFHFVLLIPTELKDLPSNREHAPDCFELQIKTLFQHAWSEANHDLGYKANQAPLEREEARQLAYTSAQAWGADRVFDDLFRKRSDSF